MHDENFRPLLFLVPRRKRFFNCINVIGNYTRKPGPHCRFAGKFSPLPKGMNHTSPHRPQANSLLSKPAVSLRFRPISRAITGKRRQTFAKYSAGSSLSCSKKRVKKTGTKKEGDPLFAYLQKKPSEIPRFQS
jgi:hypothetical protein